MNNLKFTIAINAPKQRVWDVMIDYDTYPLWTAPFQEPGSEKTEGSNYIGKWEKDEELKFVSGEGDQAGGVICRVAEFDPYNHVSLEVTGLVVAGEVDTEGEEAKKWIGGHENYTFTENDGVTTLDIELKDAEIGQEMTNLFSQQWPQALAKLKALSES